MEESPDNTKRIRELNDLFRETMLTGKIITTQGIEALPLDDKMQIFAKVRQFDDFNEGNDPYGEHDFGSFKHQGNKIFWKIDYYDLDLQYGSENPADPSKTIRVLTIMLAEEY